MPSNDDNKAQACKTLIQNTLRLVNRGPGPRTITGTDKVLICSSEMSGVALYAQKMASGTVDVDFLSQRVVDFLMEVADKGLRNDSGSFEMTDIQDGVIYTFAKI